VFRRLELLQRRGFHRWFRQDPTDVLGFVAAAGMTVAAFWMMVRRQWLYGVLIVAYLAPAVAIDLPATGRMTALLFPVFVWLASRVRGGWFVALASLFAYGEGWLAWRFFLWQTPY
jgi:heme/copper-type cytochrome/quinol oxidase subunit 4